MFAQWGWIGVAALGLIAAATTILAEDCPEPGKLPAVNELPDPLVTFGGARVASPDEWRAKRRPELKALFEHYMYGYAPPAPEKIDARAERVESNYFGGKATKKEVTLSYGPPGTPKIHLLVVTPNDRKKPAPVFVGLNFFGNHSLLADPKIALSESWIPDRAAGAVQNRATEASRGTAVDVWNLEYVIGRGYAVATCYAGDIDPDRNDFTDGVHPHYSAPGQSEPRPQDWGTIRAWAWGVSRIVDYVVTDPDLDKQRIAVVGHSRLGKTALVAAAFDERIALAIPHQAGCGGTAPSRGTVGESVKRINTSFPHWFNDEFPKFNDLVERLPFDQNALVALVAPRPVFFTNATEDTWANPDGQFQVLAAADPVYRFLGVGGLASKEPPPIGQLSNGTLGYFIRPGKHSMTKPDWDVFLEFTDKHLGKGLGTGD